MAVENCSTKTCVTCHELQPLSNFYVDRRASDGRFSSCKKCTIAGQKAARLLNHEEWKAKRREHHAKNAPKLREQRLEWYRKNAKKHAAGMRRWLEKNRDASSIIKKRWRDKNKDYANRKAREWGLRNKESRRASVLNYQARKRGASGKHTAKDIKSLYEMQRGVCITCLTSLDRGYDIDHKIPLSRGGSNSPDNLQLLCSTCNRSKHNKTHEEFIRWLKVVNDDAQRSARKIIQERQADNSSPRDT